jgi:hypothetical protein
VAVIQTKPEQGIGTVISGKVGAGHDDLTMLHSWHNPESGDCLIASQEKRVAGCLLRFAAHIGFAGRILENVWYSPLSGIVALFRF